MSEYSYFGLCPECHAEPTFVHVGKQHWATCPTHKCAWDGGYNLITTHADMDDDELRWFFGHADRERIDRENLATLQAGYQRAEPYFPQDS